MCSAVSRGYRRYAVKKISCTNTQWFWWDYWKKRFNLGTFGVGSSILWYVPPETTKFLPSPLNAFYTFVPRSTGQISVLLWFDKLLRMQGRRFCVVVKTTEYCVDQGVHYSYTLCRWCYIHAFEKLAGDAQAVFVQFGILVEYITTQGPSIIS